MFGPAASTQKVTRAVTGVIPLVLVGCVAYSAYVVVSKVSCKYSTSIHPSTTYPPTHAFVPAVSSRTCVHLGYHPVPAFD